MRGRTVLLGLLTLLAACVACAGGDSGDSDEADPTPTTTPAPTTAASAATTTAPASTTTTAPATPTATAGDQESAVIEAYLRYWEVFLLVTNPGQPDHPDIDRFATGPAADRLRQTASERLSANEATQVPTASVRRHDVTVIEVGESSAIVRDCNVDDSFRVDLATGERSNADVETNLWSAQLLRSADGRWQVAETTVINQWPGAQPCDG